MGGTAKEYTYNNANRMSIAKANGVIQATYKYNGMGEQVLRATSTTTRFVYDEGGNLLGQYDNAGNAIQQYVWMEGVPVGVLTGSGASQVMRYVQTDQLGTPRAVVDPTQQRAVWRWDESLEGFGDTAPNTDPDGNGQTFVFDLRFPGQRYDMASGLYYNYFRDYDPSIGRYTQSDPIGLLGGVNNFAYAAGNPLIFTDRRGLWFGVDDAVFGVGGALVGVGGRFVGDLLTGQFSSWEDYVGAATGGAIGGVVLLYTANPFLAGAAGGLAGNLTAQGLKLLTGKQCEFDVGSAVVDTGVGALTGFIPGRPRIAGINKTVGKNRNTDLKLFRETITKATNGTINGIRNITALRMARGAFYEYAVGFGAATSSIGSTYYGWISEYFRPSGGG